MLWREVLRRGVRCRNSLRRFSSAAEPRTSSTFGLAGVKSDGQTARFYTDVDIENFSPNDESSYGVSIDGRLLQTPQKRIMLMPSKHIALAIAGEWSRQGKFIRPSSMPFTSLATTAIDQCSNEHARKKLLEKIRTYIETDSLYFRASKPDSLAKLQAEKCDPLFDWLKTEFNAPLNVTTELFVNQPRESIERIFEAISSFDDWRLAALDSAASLSRSYIVGLAFAHGKLDAEQCFEVARIDEEYQINNWGCVEGGHDIDQAFINMRLSAAEALLELVDLKEQHTE